MKVLQQKVRISLKNLESLSYNFVKPDQLKQILQLTKQLEATIRPRPIMLKILPIMLLSNAQIFDLLCSILCSCVHKN